MSEEEVGNLVCEDRSEMEGLVGCWWYEGRGRRRACKEEGGEPRAIGRRSVWWLSGRGSGSQDLVQDPRVDNDAGRALVTEAVAERV